MGFTGYQVDDVSGVYYAQARYYDAKMGRFGAEDIIRSKSADVFEQRILDIDLADKIPVINVSQICTVDDLISQNYYTYANSSPISHIDSSGHFALALAGAGAAGGVISGGTAIGAANVWNPVGWVILGAVAVTAIGVGIYLATKDKVTADADADEQSDDKTNECEDKERSKNPPEKRKHYKSKKEAKEAAQRAGKGNPPVHHPDGDHGPHYHPDVPMPKNPTPKAPNPHDHYYYPKGN